MSFGDGFPSATGASGTQTRRTPSPRIAPANVSSRYAYSCENSLNPSSESPMYARESPCTGTTFSCPKWPNCGVSTYRPELAFRAIDVPCAGLCFDSSPVRYHRPPSIVSSVLEQNHSKPSVPSTGYDAATTAPSACRVRGETRAPDGSNRAFSSWFMKTSTEPSLEAYQP